MRMLMVRKLTCALLNFHLGITMNFLECQKLNYLKESGEHFGFIELAQTVLDNGDVEDIEFLITLIDIHNCTEILASKLICKAEKFNNLSIKSQYRLAILNRMLEKSEYQTAICE